MFSSSLSVAIAILYSNEVRNRRQGTLSFPNFGKQQFNGGQVLKVWEANTKLWVWACAVLQGFNLLACPNSTTGCWLILLAVLEC